MHLFPVSIIFWPTLYFTWAATLGLTQSHFNNILCLSGHASSLYKYKLCSSTIFYPESWIEIQLKWTDFYPIFSSLCFEDEYSERLQTLLVTNMIIDLLLECCIGKKRLICLLYNADFFFIYEFARHIIPFSRFAKFFSL